MASGARSVRDTHMPTAIQPQPIEKRLNIETATQTPVLQPPGMDERRSTPRFRKRLTAKIIGVGAAEVFRCTTEDISDNGLYVQVPLASGLRVGQRCEVVLPDDVGESHYATVVRTEPIAKAPDPIVGAGLRFDQPLFL